jgi:hypothetical protein
MAEFEKVSFYVDLDALLDTRAGTLFRHDPKVLELNLQKDYYLRTTDEFEGIDFDLYRELYSKRDIETLKHSLVTRVMPMLMDFAKDTLRAIINSPYQRQPKVVINIFPYELSESTERYVIAAVRALSHGLFDVEVIRTSYENLTPSYVKSNFLFMAMYSYWEWLDAQAQNGEFEKTQCPHVTLIGPQLIKSKEAERLLKGIDAFDAIEKYSSPFIRLSLFPVAQFCADLQRIKEHAKRENASASEPA